MTPPPLETENAELEAGAWARKLRGYRKADARRGVFELAITLIPFALTWFFMLVAFEKEHFWLYGLLLLPTAGFLVRLFMIQHDCGHGSFFPNKRANEWAGRVIGILTLTPYYYWRRNHAVHHASSGNLARRGIGDVRTLTVAEYVARSRLDRFRYRLYRHPCVMFGLGPLYLFVLEYRLPVGFMRKGWRPWFSTMGTTATIAVLVILATRAVGLPAFLWVQVPIVAVGAGVGVWLFYIQHQFEHTYWAKGENWNAHDAALYGSSHYSLPVVLRWFTANIGVHHVHHLSSRIPYYRFPEVLRNHPELRKRSRLTLLESLQSTHLALWDEECRRLVSFKEIRNRTG